MKLIIKACLLFLLLVGCEKRLIPDVRLLVNGNVVDENETGLEGARVSVYTRRSSGNIFSGISGSEEFLMGRNFSDSNGDFSVISLFDKDEDFLIEINSSEEFTEYYYQTNTEDFIPDNYTIDLPNVRLPRKSTFNYNIQRNSSLGTEIQFSFQYQDDFCVEVYNEGELDELQSSCFENSFLNRTLDDNLPDISGSISSILGSEIIFTYSINSGTEMSQIITLDQPNYEFSYTY